MTIPPSELAFVPFVSVENMMRLIHATGIESMIEGIADYIEDDFKRWESFDKKPRIPAHSDEGVIELMPTDDGELFGFKYVNGHPVNTTKGLQTVTAFGLLSQMKTGYPVMLTEMTVLTAMRTAAMSALVGKYLAPKGATTMALIGNGAQSEFQARAFKALCGIDTVRLYDIDAAATEKCARNLADSGLTVVKCSAPEEAIMGAQIITTCTADKKNATILTDNMVGSGVHINAIGGDCPGKTELHHDIVARSDMFVEYPPQTRIEGELQQMPLDHPYTELWNVFNGTAKGRSSDPDQITLFDSVGFAVEDFSALRYVHNKIQGTDFYVDLDMLADPDDPRDLFGMLMRAK